MRAELPARARPHLDRANESVVADGLVLVESQPQLRERLVAERVPQQVATRGAPLAVVGTTANVRRAQISNT